MTTFRLPVDGESGGGGCPPGEECLDPDDLCAPGLECLDPADLIPQEPVAGMLAWYDAADTDTLTIVSNKVSQWDDKSANGFDLTQATAARRPDYNAAPRTISGIIVPEFVQATDQFMESACPVDDRTATYFIVGLVDDTGARAIVSSTQVGGFEIRFNANVNFVKATTAILATFPHNVGPVVPFVLAMRTTAADAVLSLGGFTTVPIATATALTAATTLRVGKDQTGVAAQRWDGLIGEVVIYNSTLSDEDMYTTLVYLIAKWLR